ncbi:hypothetical protein [Rhizobium sp. RAF56]|uniref:hypothetical protein n=1 Tax=Rhizobium sp. RAF56 TaxID=3233062 RepID=UPI003F974374
MTLRTRHTIVRASSRMTKLIELDADGKLMKQAAVTPASGSLIDCAYEAEDAQGLLQLFADALEDLSPREVILLSTLPSAMAPGDRHWRLCTKENEGAPGTLARTKANFGPVTGLAIGALDFDLPPQGRVELPHAGALIDRILVPAWPGFAHTALLVRPSVSAGAKLIGGEAPLPSGYHVYFVIDDGRYIEPICKLLFNRLAAMGHAVVLPSKRGARLRRALVDAVASSPERLIFEADPMLGPGVEPVMRDIVIEGERVLVADEIMRDLMAANVRDDGIIAANWAAAEEAAAPLCEAARAKWIEGRVDELAVVEKKTRPEARVIAQREAQAYDAGVLTDDFVIDFDDGTSATVLEILSDPDRFKSKKGPSLDEDRPRPGVTMVWPYRSAPDPATGKPEGPWLHSFEHGGRYWRLRLKAVLEAEEAFKALFDIAHGMIANEIGHLKKVVRNG